MTPRRKRANGGGLATPRRASPPVRPSIPTKFRLATRFSISRLRSRWPVGHQLASR